MRKHVAGHRNRDSSSLGSHQYDCGFLEGLRLPRCHSHLPAGARSGMRGMCCPKVFCGCPIASHRESNSTSLVEPKRISMEFSMCDCATHFCHYASAAGSVFLRTGRRRMASGVGRRPQRLSQGHQGHQGHQGQGGPKTK